MFDSIIDFIVSVYTFPVRTWQGSCSNGAEVVVDDWGQHGCAAPDNYGFYYEPDRVAGLGFGLVIYGATAAIVAVVAYKIYIEISWRRNRVACQHCQQWTVETSEGDHPGCLNGHGCCDDCFERHIDEAVERRAAQEASVTCSNCSSQMDKVIEHRIVLDVCGECGAVFLHPDELDELEKIAHSKGYDIGYRDGKLNNSKNGMLVGLVIGSALN